jgi:hypothetical protein
MKVRHFSSDAVIAAAETWLDGQPSELFLSGLRNLVAVACFLPGRAKDLSAPRYKQLKKRTSFDVYAFLPDLSQNVKKASRMVTDIA